MIALRIPDIIGNQTSMNLFSNLSLEKKRLYAILASIVLVTLPCYLLGFFLISQAPPAETATPASTTIEVPPITPLASVETPAPIQTQTSTATPTPTRFTPPTLTPTLTLGPTLTQTPTETPVTPTPTETFTITPTGTDTLTPTSTPPTITPPPPEVTDSG